MAYYLPPSRYAAINRIISELLARDKDIVPSQIAAPNQDEEFGDISYVLLSELRLSERKWSQVRADNTKLQADNAALDGDNMALHTNNTNLQTDNTTLATQNAAFQAQITTFQNLSANRRIVQLEAIVEDKVAKIAEYEIRMEQQEREKKDLQMTLEDKEEEIAKLVRDQ